MRRAWELAEAGLAFLLAGVYTLLVVSVLHPRTVLLSANDLKLMWASAWCLAHGRNAYDQASLVAVYQRFGFAAPALRLANAVYPPQTLVCLLPFTGMEMERSLRLIIGLYALPLGAAVWALLRYGRTALGLGRLGLVSLLVLASPCLITAMILGNVTVPAACLSMLAFLSRRLRAWWPGAVACGLALALKPHVALCVVAPLLLLPERRSRRIAVGGLGLFALFSLLVLGGLAVTHQLGPQMRGYGEILGTQTSGRAGMSAATREISSLTIQVTSLRSMAGFWGEPDTVVSVACGLALLACAVLLAVETRRARNERDVLLCVVAWTALGLSAIYHRAYDGFALALAFPWVVAELTTRGHRLRAVVVAALLLALNLGPAAQTVFRRSGEGQARTLMAFLLMRQAALAALGLAVFCIFLLRDAKKAVLPDGPTARGAVTS